MPKGFVAIQTAMLNAIRPVSPNAPSSQYRCNHTVPVQLPLAITTARSRPAQAETQEQSRMMMKGADMANTSFLWQTRWLSRQTNNIRGHVT
jgi:hypothetical protein